MGPTRPLLPRGTAPHQRGAWETCPGPSPHSVHQSGLWRDRSNRREKHTCIRLHICLSRCVFMYVYMR